MERAVTETRLLEILQREAAAQGYVKIKPEALDWQIALAAMRALADDMLQAAEAIAEDATLEAGERHGAGLAATAMRRGLTATSPSRTPSQ